MKIQSSFRPPAAPSTAHSKVPTPTSPDSVQIGGNGPQGPKGPPAWTSLEERPQFVTGWSSRLLMGVCGPIAVALSKTGNALDQMGQKLGWWQSLGTIKKPLPPSLLTDLPESKIQRPVVLVPGWQTPEDRFDHLAEKLTSDGKNGGRVYYVRDGEFYADLDCTQRMMLEDTRSDGKVFVAVFPSVNTPPNLSAPELAKDLKAISALTGNPKADVVGYSMGGLATRTYLDQGGDRVGKFMMLGTPNRGSALARTSLGLLDLQAKGWDTQWLLSRKPITEDDRNALGWLRPVTGGPANPQLADLNSRWESQKARTEAVRLVGSHSRPTLGRYFIPVLGDGTVPGNSLQIGEENPHFLKNRNHRNHGLLFSNPQTYLEMRDFFGWDK
ncbi:alpha/beta fold hydrolase [bacterium]|nr:alpha/beta fold hydrolase [bacterium]